MVSKKKNKSKDEDDLVLEFQADGTKQKDTEYKNMAWKGFEDPEAEIDDDYMTPMVDVTFLLLIFFMVTASFSLQKSIQQPPAQTDEPSTVVEERELDDDTITVLIDENNTFYVTSRHEEDIECPSDREMRQRIKDAKEAMGSSKLVIRAHVDSFHKKVIAAWDAGVIAQIENIVIETTEEEL